MKSIQIRVYVAFELEEYKSLTELARLDLREGREEIRWLVREEAKRRGLTHVGADAAISNHSDGQEQTAAPLNSGR